MSQGVRHYLANGRNQSGCLPVCHALILREGLGVLYLIMPGGGEMAEKIVRISDLPARTPILICESWRRALLVEYEFLGVNECPEDILVRSLLVLGILGDVAQRGV